MNTALKKLTVQWEERFINRLFQVRGEGVLMEVCAARYLGIKRVVSPALKIRKIRFQVT